MTGKEFEALCKNIPGFIWAMFGGSMILAFCIGSFDSQAEWAPNMMQYIYGLAPWGASMLAWAGNTGILNIRERNGAQIER